MSTIPQTWKDIEFLVNALYPVLDRLTVKSQNDDNSSACARPPPSDSDDIDGKHNDSVSSSLIEWRQFSTLSEPVRVLLSSYDTDYASTHHSTHCQSHDFLCGICGLDTESDHSQTGIAIAPPRVTFNWDLFALSHSHTDTHQSCLLECENETNAQRWGDIAKCVATAVQHPIIDPNLQGEEFVYASARLLFHAEHVHAWLGVHQTQCADILKRTHIPHSCGVDRLFELWRQERFGACVLMVCAFLERLVGNICVAQMMRKRAAEVKANTTHEKKSGQKPAKVNHIRCPTMMRDILVADGVVQILGANTCHVLQMLVGPPTGLNLRNLLWHGFMPLHELESHLRGACALFIVVLTAIASMEDVEELLHDQEANVRKLWTVDSHFVFDNELGKYLSHAAAHNCTNTDTKTSVDFLVSAQSTFASPSSRKDMLLAETLRRSGEYDTALLYLFPALEFSLRRIFVTLHGLPINMLTAEQVVLYTTLDQLLEHRLRDDLFEAATQCTDENNADHSNMLDSIVPLYAMRLFRDVFLHRNGLRLRDRIAHGEVDLHELNTNKSTQVCVDALFSSVTDLSRLFVIRPPLLDPAPGDSASVRSYMTEWSGPIGSKIRAISCCLSQLHQLQHSIAQLTPPDSAAEQFKLASEPPAIPYLGSKGLAIPIPPSVGDEFPSLLSCSTLNSWLQADKLLHMPISCGGLEFESVCVCSDLKDSCNNLDDLHWKQNGALVQMLHCASCRNSDAHLATALSMPVPVAVKHVLTRFQAWLDDMEVYVALFSKRCMPDKLGTLSSSQRQSLSIALYFLPYCHTVMHYALRSCMHILHTAVCSQLTNTERYELLSSKANCKLIKRISNHVGKCSSAASKNDIRKLLCAAFELYCIASSAKDEISRISE
jgi:Domain of unknown function (DUF4209)